MIRIYCGQRRRSRHVLSNEASDGRRNKNSGVRATAITGVAESHVMRIATHSCTESQVGGTQTYFSSIGVAALTATTVVWDSSYAHFGSRKKERGE